MNFIKIALILMASLTFAKTDWLPQHKELGIELNQFIKNHPKIRKIDAQNYTQEINGIMFQYKFNQLKLTQISAENFDQKEMQKWAADKKFIFEKSGPSTDQPHEQYRLYEEKTGLILECKFPFKIEKISLQKDHKFKGDSKNIIDIIKNLSNPEVIKK